MNIKHRLLTSVILGTTAVALFILPSFAHAVVNETVVNGQVKDASNNPINTASVSIICNGATINTSTDASGKYSATFDGTACPEGTTVTVHATKGGQNGSGSKAVKKVYDDGSVIINLVLINISVPEFGLLTGVITTLASTGAYLFLKRKVA